MQSITANLPITNPKEPANLYLRPATLYYLRLEFPSTGNGTGKGGNIATSCGNTPLVLYKLGYTTTTLHERVYGRPTTYNTRYVHGRMKVLRIAGHVGMGLPPGTQVFIISTLDHRNGALVLAWEQYLHSKYTAQRYNGPPPMANGNTELYTRDILDLDY